MILDDIVAYKTEFLAHRRRAVPLADVVAMARDTPAPAGGARFAAAIARKRGGDVNVIAEVKKASPSKGIIREDFDPVAIAATYAAHGAAAISVLTDEAFFQGHLDFLRAVAAETSATPLLRKDFTIDEYQIHEARAAGAAAILLIAGILDRHQLVGFRELAAGLGMDTLTEVHLEAEADLAAELGAPVMGINNRDLRDFSVDLGRTGRIVEMLGGAGKGIVFVAESGISTPADVERVRAVGVDAILVGESLMRQCDPGVALAALMARPEPPEE